MPKFDPSFGAEDAYERQEEAFAAEIAFWRDHRHEILRMARAIIASPDMMLRIVDANCDPSGAPSSTPIERLIMDSAAEMVRHAVSKGEDHL